MSYIFLLSGNAGSGKSVCALSGEGLTGYHEFDPRSFARACAGVQIDKDQVVVSYHPSPRRDLSDLGKVSVGGTGGVAPTAERHLIGWREGYIKFVQAYMENLANPEVQQIVWDTETRCWQMHHYAWHQQMQEAQAAQNQAEIKRLTPLEFTEAKRRYLENTDAANQDGKHLILVTHLKEEWKNNKATGNLIPESHKDAPGNADLILEFSFENGGSVATIKKIAGPYGLLGMRIKQPTIPYLVNLLDSISLLQDAKLPLPDPLSLEAILKRAEVARGAG